MARRFQVSPRNIKGVVLLCVLRDSSDQLKTTEPHQNERAMLSEFMLRLGKADPDIILGHNLLGFDLDVLLHRFVETCNH